jgi:RNA 3'-terminal phosphate cyclase (ATP)
MNSCASWRPTALSILPGDQLTLPLLLAGGTSRIRTSEITSHLLTNAAVLDAFKPGCINIRGQPGKSGTIVIQPWT